MKFIKSYHIEEKDQLTALDAKVSEELTAMCPDFMHTSTDMDKQIASIRWQHDDLVKNLFRRDTNSQDMLLHAVLGISGESGELVDAVKKHWAYDKQLDIGNILEECGDLLFYLKAMLMQFGYDISAAEAANFAKLSKRYPKGTFTAKDAIERKDKQ